MTYRPSATFYLAPTRAWELLLGALLAVRAIPPLESRIWQELGGMLGLVLIAYGLFMLTDQSPFPGANALFPAGGAALVIYSANNGETSVSKLLSTTPLVFVGLISYSLYLWHWPFLICPSLRKSTCLHRGPNGGTRRFVGSDGNPFLEICRAAIPQASRVLLEAAVCWCSCRNELLRSVWIGRLFLAWSA